MAGAEVDRDKITGEFVSAYGCEDSVPRYEVLRP